MAPAALSLAVRAHVAAARLRRTLFRRQAAQPGAPQQHRRSSPMVLRCAGVSTASSRSPCRLRVVRLAAVAPAGRRTCAHARCRRRRSPSRVFAPLSLLGDDLLEVAQRGGGDLVHAVALVRRSARARRRSPLAMPPHRLHQSPRDCLAAARWWDGRQRRPPRAPGRRFAAGRPRRPRARGRPPHRRQPEARCRRRRSRRRSRRRHRRSDRRSSTGSEAGDERRGRQRGNRLAAGEAHGGSSRRGNGRYAITGRRPLLPVMPAPPRSPFAATLWPPADPGRRLPWRSASSSPSVVAFCDAAAPRLATSEPSLLLVTLDTTRADHLQPYGARDVPTPALQSLADAGVLFEHAHSVAPITLVAHSTVLTGLYPPQHGVRNNGTHHLPTGDRHACRAPRGRAATSTAAFVSAAVLDRRYGLVPSNRFSKLLNRLLYLPLLVTHLYPGI